MAENHDLNFLYQCILPTLFPSNHRQLKKIKNHNTVLSKWRILRRVVRYPQISFMLIRKAVMHLSNQKNIMGHIDKCYLKLARLSSSLDREGKINAGRFLYSKTQKLKLAVQSHPLRQSHAWLEYEPWVNSPNTVSPTLQLLLPWLIFTAEKLTHVIYIPRELPVCKVTAELLCPEVITHPMFLLTAVPYAVI